MAALVWFLPSKCSHMDYETSILKDFFYHNGYIDMLSPQYVSSDDL